jgi:glutathione reductase (NADPH)
VSEQFDYDFFVIGAGSGGVRGGRIAAALGARVAICEDDRFGGTCTNVGCVPKKLFMYGSRYRAEAEDARGYGWHFPEPTFSWKTLIENKNAEILRLNGVYERILERAGCTIIPGRGTIKGPHTVEVAGRSYTARNILIATGGRPLIPPVPGAELGLSSDQIFSIDALPQRVAIIGGGYIGVEFASIFRGFGSEVALVHRNAQILNRGFDDDVTSFLAGEMTKQGIALHLGKSVTALRKNPDGSIQVAMGGTDAVDVDLVLWATGRKPNATNLGLETVEVVTNDWGAIEVDEFYRTAEPSIYACGDVVDRMALTPVALAEGMQIARNLFGGQSRTVDYSLIPTAVFSRPNISMVGLTEQQAREKGLDIEIYRSNFRGMKHTMSGRDERTLMKLIVERGSDRVLGCHMCGAEAGEIIQGLAVALKAGATKAVFDSTIGIHPTAAEEFVTMRTPVSG